jgi:DNA polymerase V
MKENYLWGKERDAVNGKSAAIQDGSFRCMDLNKQLVGSGPESFCMQVNSDAMREAGIQRGDMVIVDRCAEAGSGKVIIAILNGEMLIRRLDISNNKRRLLPAGKLSPIEIMDGASFSIWGVVTYVIRCV